MNFYLLIWLKVNFWIIKIEPVELIFERCSSSFQKWLTNICSVRLLKDALHDAQFGARYEHVLGALLSVGGKGLREELLKQTKLVQLLGGVAEKVKQASGSARQVCTHKREHNYSDIKGSLHAGKWSCYSLSTNIQ